MKKPRIKIAQMDGVKSIIYDFGNMESADVNKWFANWYSTVSKHKRIHNLQQITVGENR